MYSANYQITLFINSNETLLLASAWECALLNSGSRAALRTLRFCGELADLLNVSAKIA